MPIQFWLKSVIDSIRLLFYAIYVYLELLYRLIVPSASKSLTGETILITGCGNGIGKQICLQLAKSGAKLVCWDVIKRDNDDVVQELKNRGAQAYAYEVDISERSQVETVAAMVKRDVGDVTIVINNAGVAICQEFLKHSPEVTEKTFRVNVLGQMWILREFLPKMIELKKGHIVTTCSICGIKGNRYMVPYHGSKFAVHGYLEALKDELRRHPDKPDIKFTTIYPTAVKTQMSDPIEFNFRFPALTPILEPEYVARRLIHGLKTNQEFVYCPRYLSILFYEQLLPTKIKAAISDFLMHDFGPRSGDNQIR